MLVRKAKEVNFTKKTAFNVAVYCEVINHTETSKILTEEGAIVESIWVCTEDIPTKDGMIFLCNVCQFEHVLQKKVDLLTRCSSLLYLVSTIVFKCPKLLFHAKNSL